VDIKSLKDWWWLWGLILILMGGVATFMVKTSDIVAAPQKIQENREKIDEYWDKTNEQFQQFYGAQTQFLTQQQTYIAQNEERWRRQETDNERFYDWNRGSNG